MELPGRREEATGEGNHHLSHVSPVEPTTGRATPTPTREEIHLTLHRTRHSRYARQARHTSHTRHSSGSRRTTSSSRHRSRSTKSDCTSRRSLWAQRAPDPAAVAQVMTAPPAAVDGHTAPPDPAAEAVTPAMPRIAPREEEPDRPKRTWQDPVKQTEARLKPPLLQQE